MPTMTLATPCTMALHIPRTPRTVQFRGQALHVEELGACLPFACKPDNLREMCATGEHRIYITETVEMTPAEFDAFRLAAPADPDRLGLVFGSSEGRGHGVFATRPARFTLLSFRIL